MHIRIRGGEQVSWFYWFLILIMDLIKCLFLIMWTVWCFHLSSLSNLFYGFNATIF